MTIARQDAWNDDEDVLLAEIVLRHIREGSTQLKAFEEVGIKLSRTPAACGFRWNSFVRKQYATGIELAKKQRKNSKSHHPRSEKMPAPDSRIETEQKPITMDEVLLFLSKLDERSVLGGQEKEKLEREIESLTLQLEEARLENRRLREKLMILEEDYRTMLAIMERARKLSVLEEEEHPQKVKFQMDQNGNLERVHK